MRRYFYSIASILLLTGSLSYTEGKSPENEPGLPNKTFVVKDIYAVKCYGPYDFSPASIEKMTDQAGFSLALSKKDPDKFLIKYYVHGMGKSTRPYPFTNRRYFKVNGRTYKLITNKEDIRKTLKSTREDALATNQSVKPATKIDENSQYGKLYYKYFIDFESPIRKFCSLKMANGHEVTGRVISVRDTKVDVMDGKIKLTLPRDEMSVKSWLQCNAKDYAKYYANKAFNKKQEPYIINMFKLEQKYIRENLIKSMYRDFEKSTTKYKTESVKEPCKMCHGSGYIGGRMQRSTGESSRLTCSHCHGAGYTITVKHIPLPETTVKYFNPPTSYNTNHPLKNQIYRCNSLANANQLVKLLQTQNQETMHSHPKIAESNSKTDVQYTLRYKVIDDKKHKGYFLIVPQQ